MMVAKHSSISFVIFIVSGRQTSASTTRQTQGQIPLARNSAPLPAVECELSKPSTSHSQLSSDIMATQDSNNGGVGGSGSNGSGAGGSSGGTGGARPKEDSSSMSQAVAGKYVLIAKHCALSIREISPMLLILLPSLWNFLHLSF